MKVGYDPHINSAQAQRLYVIAKREGGFADSDTVKEFLRDQYGVESALDLRWKDQYPEACALVALPHLAAIYNSDN